MSTSRSTQESFKPVTVNTLRRMKADKEKVVMLTAYDASFAQLADENGVDVLLVGDSLGNVVQGRESTVSVTMDDMVYHTACVARGRRRALIVADMPFLSYPNPDEALYNAARLMKEGGAHMLKLEGGRVIADIVAALTSQGVPVCAHLGLLPQSVHKMGGFRVQAREESEANKLIEDAQILVEAGVDMIVLECIPANLAARVTASVNVPVIGIGAGVECDGQVLVIYDMLGITPAKRPKFTKDFLQEAGSVPAAISAYVNEVKNLTFPGASHAF